MKVPRDVRYKRITQFLEEYPQLVDEVFRFLGPELRLLALEDPESLSSPEQAKLMDRIKYLKKSRLPDPHPPRPRCNRKAIYDEPGARAVAKGVWQAGRGEMRIYQCPLCTGYHLTHTELREDLGSSP